VEVIATSRSRVSMGEAVNLTCAVVSGGDTSRNSFMWYFNNFIISSASTSPYFNIPAVMESDTGTYTCNVTNEVGSGFGSIAITLGGEQIIENLN